MAYVPRWDAIHHNQHIDMKRQIKYRGFGTGEMPGIWYQGCLLVSANGTSYICQPRKSNPNDLCGDIVDPKSVGMSSNNRDKDGTEIFEGDIVRRDWEYHHCSMNPEDEYTTTGYIIGEVKFAPCSGFYIKGYSVSNDHELDEPDVIEVKSAPLNARKCAVIGNVYEMPEMVVVAKTFALVNAYKLNVSNEYRDTHIIPSLHTFFNLVVNDGGNINDYIDNGVYPGMFRNVLRINDVADENCMVEFTVRNIVNNVYYLDFIGRMKG